jgi:hypothetical protein
MIVMNWYTVCWVAWGVFFLAVEGKALFNKRDGDTLSEHVWKWFRVFDPRPTGWVVAARVLLGTSLLWLTLHLTMGWLTPSDPLPW